MYRLGVVIHSHYATNRRHGDLVPLGYEIAGDLVPEVANHRGYQIPVTPVIYVHIIDLWLTY